MLYLFHKIDKEKSLSYFVKAIKYSKPKSAFHTSYALLHKALIHFDMGNTVEAEEASFEAISLSPNFTEALYQNAQYNAQLLNIDKSIANLEKAIRSDKLYCLKANKDPMFDPIRERVNRLFEKLRAEEKKKSQDSFVKLSKKHKASNPIIVDISKENFIDASSWVTKSNKLSHDLKTLNSKILRNSYFDFLEINNNIAPNIRKNQDDLISELKQKIRNTVASFERNISGAKSKHESKIKEYLGNTGSAILIGSFAVPAILCLLTESGWSKLLFIVFLIPIFSQLVTIVVLFQFITNYHKADSGDLVFGWGIVLFLVASFVYYLASQKESKGEMKKEITMQKNLKEAAAPYIERVKNL